uniref:Uncharacterized protein n=1 Tax=Anguilla anguilla TaxID=7936 RepID=A0A0E9PWP0_ANGAN
MRLSNCGGGSAV